jgi:hypothetical protein
MKSSRANKPCTGVKWLSRSGLPGSSGCACLFPPAWPNFHPLGIIERMEYSSTFEFLLFVIWAFGSLLLSWFARRLFYVYCGSVALSAPMIGSSMVGYGLLPMGGIIHGLCAGLLLLPFHFLVQRFRTRRTVPR